MKKDLYETFNLIKQKGISAYQEKKILKEINYTGTHGLPMKNSSFKRISGSFESAITANSTIFKSDDFRKLSNIFSVPNYVHVLKSIDELLKRDEKRTNDGFPKKIKLGKIMKPSDKGKNKIVIIPSVVEEKLIHDNRPIGKEPETGGSGSGEEGETIGEEPIHTTQDGDATGSGEGGDTLHEIESTAYDLGRILTEEFKLPNIKDKGKKKSFTKYTYDLTDKNRGFGQYLDKKATLKEIIETNLALGNIQDVRNIDPSSLIVSPADKVYRTLSKERDYESQAVVFFVRDYSGSMDGKPTDLVVSQHLLIYTWLMYQYENNVETRFVLHDTDAKEVKDFYTYYNTSVAGGTKLSVAYRLVNKIVEDENLAADYNIYIFQGTDGEDWDSDGKDAIEEIKKIFKYVNRLGITIADNYYKLTKESVVEKYIRKSGLLDSKELIRLDSLKSDSDQERLIMGIKKLIS